MQVRDSFIDLRLGDCLDVMAALPAACVDLVLCDLPYGTTRNKWDSAIPLEPLWRAYRRVAKPDAAIVLTAQAPFDKALGASNLAMLRYEWIWHKNNPSGHLNANRAPMKAHENVLVFYEKQPTYNPQKTTGHERKRTTRRGFSANYGAQRETSIDTTERFPRSVIEIAGHPKSETTHPTQKPVALMEYLIRTYTNAGALVLDNCMGSGTTGVACANTGRDFLGIERDPGYFAMARERIAALDQLETAA